MDDKHNCRVHTKDRFKVKINRSLVILIACLALYITANWVALATTASITISQTSAPMTAQVTVHEAIFGVKETFTISVDLPGKHPYPDKRYHDWLRPANTVS